MSNKILLERHHILEIISTKDGSDGDYGTVIINSHKKLKELGLYGHSMKENYGLPSWMICICTPSEHRKLHMKFDKNWCKKSGESRKGMTLSDETKRKMSESRKGMTISDETKRKIGESNKGMTRSDETKKKLSESHTTSFFGEKFNEHYGITKYQDKKLYKREWAFYKRNGFLRWEQEKKDIE